MEAQTIERKDQTRLSPLHFDFREGRDEINFAEFPLWHHSTRSPAVKTLVFESSINDRGAGRLIKRKLTITAADAWGLPTVRDADVLFALLLIAWQTTQFKNREVHFSYKQLLDVLGWDDSGNNYKRIDLALKRWDGVHIVYDGWYDIVSGTWSKRPMMCGILSGGKLRATKQSRGEEEQLSFVRWHEDFLPTLQAGSIRRFDMNKWQSIRSPSAKQAYRYLEKEFHIKPVVKVDLRQFACEHVGLSRNEKPNKLRKALNDIFTELEAIHCIEKVPPETRYQRIDRSTWEVTIKKCRTTAIPNESRQAELFPNNPLAAELESRGVTKSTAESLLTEHDSEVIQRQLEFLDWRISQGETIKSPGGYLRAAIQQDYAPPKGFKTKSEQKSERERTEKAAKTFRAKRKQQEELEAQQERENLDRKAAQWQAIESYLATLSKKERDQIEDDAIIGKDLNNMATKYRISRTPGTLEEATYQGLMKQHVLPLLDQLAIT